jgi:hypothetical protein
MSGTNGSVNAVGVGRGVVDGHLDELAEVAAALAR